MSVLLSPQVSKLSKKKSASVSQDWRHCEPYHLSISAYLLSIIKPNLVITIETNAM